MDAQPLHLAVVFPKTLWERKMSPGRRHAIDAIRRQPGVRVTLTGPGFDGYDVASSVQANLDRVAPGCQAVLWYKPLGGRDAIPLVDPLGLRVPAVMAFNEAYWEHDRAALEVVRSGTKLVVCHHENDLPRFPPAAMTGVTLVHIPHGAERSVFASRARPQDERDIGCLVTGVLNDETYPLRGRWARLVRQGFIPGEVRKHPGYRLPSVTGCRDQFHDYARHLGRAKIALYCTSVYKYALAKIVEAAMAGCVLIGDLPDDRAFHKSFGHLVVPVEADWPDEKLMDTVFYWLDNERERIELADATQHEALRYFTMDHYAARFLEAVRGVLGQQTLQVAA